jgi:hypothetical protein
MRQERYRAVGSDGTVVGAQRATTDVASGRHPANTATGDLGDLAVWRPERPVVPMITMTPELRA